MKKIVVIADTHRQHWNIKVPNCDLFIFCGDAEINGLLPLHDFNDWLGTIKATHKIMVGGNHDSELERIGKKECKRLLTNCIYLENEFVEVGGFKIWGSPYSPMFNAWSFMRYDNSLKEIWDTIPLETEILITHCTIPSYKTLTYDLRWKQLGNLKVGDELLAFDEHPINKSSCGRCYRKSVVNHISFHNMPTFLVTLSNGEQFEVTENHLWLVTQGKGWNNKWLTTKQLKSRKKYGSRVCTKLKKVLDVWEDKTDWNSGYIAGIFDGEGFISPAWNYDMGFAQNPNIVLEKVIQHLTDAGLKVANYSKHGGYSPRQNCRSVNFRGSFPDKLKFLGSYRPYRLLEKFMEDKYLIDKFNYRLQGFNKNVIYVDNIEEYKKQEIVSIGTTTKTLFVNGYPMHNCPPFGILDQVLPRDDSQGSRTLKDRVKDVHPYLHLFGHIHEGFGQYTDGKTDYYNCSVLDEQYKLTNPVIEIII